jgi:hypothetical protein
VVPDLARYFLIDRRHQPRITRCLVVSRRVASRFESKYLVFSTVGFRDSRVRVFLLRSGFTGPNFDLSKRNLFS